MRIGELKSLEWDDNYVHSSWSPTRHRFVVNVVLNFAFFRTLVFVTWRRENRRCLLKLLNVDVDLVTAVVTLRSTTQLATVQLSYPEWRNI